MFAQIENDTELNCLRARSKQTMEKCVIGLLTSAFFTKTLCLFCRCRTTKNSVLFSNQPNFYRFRIWQCFEHVGALSQSLNCVIGDVQLDQSAIPNGRSPVFPLKLEIKIVNF